MNALFPEMPRRGTAKTDAEQEGRNAFGKRLEALMLSRGLTQTSLARRSSLDRSVISRLINGRNRVNNDQVFALAEALGVDPAALWGGSDAQESSVKTSGVSYDISPQSAQIASMIDTLPVEARVEIVKFVILQAQAFRSGIVRIPKKSDQ